jgi:endonuclease G, mitochondrial
MKKLILAAFLTIIPTSAFASDCDKFFPNGKEIVVPNTKVICHSFYASVFDSKNEANVFSTELAQNKDKKTPRVDAFRADPAVADSPTPEDYTNTGFDRGHMTPAADSSNPTQMSDTFYMTNMTPQYPNVNRIAWKKLEMKVRTLSFKNVITGAVYAPNYAPTIGKHKVPVPIMLYKIVYLTDGSIQAFAADNVKENKEAKPVDINLIETKTGIKFH